MSLQMLSCPDSVSACLCKRVCVCYHDIAVISFIITISVIVPTVHVCYTRQEADATKSQIFCRLQRRLAFLNNHTSMHMM